MGAVHCCLLPTAGSGHSPPITTTGTEPCAQRTVVARHSNRQGRGRRLDLHCGLPLSGTTGFSWRRREGWQGEFHPQFGGLALDDLVHQPLAGREVQEGQAKAIPRGTGCIDSDRLPF